eukprot:TRINITY_DN729_c0_g1_i6.p1 TRINITY_DN729_c0_g1~~TRINITY_DN729_c0_g1_i6.p1  ORF type:complete len:778 (+),score=-54.02 TRINITY_DN729_c0_g1_i6:302-2635(+)
MTSAAIWSLQPYRSYALATGTLTLKQVLALTRDQGLNLASPAVQELRAAGTLTLKQVLALTRDQRDNLASPVVQELRAAGTLTLKQVLAITKEQRENLASPAVQELRAAGTLTLEQALALTKEQRENLASPAVQELRAAGTLTLEQALALTKEQRENLASPAVQELRAAGTLTLEQALALTWDQRRNLESAAIRELLTAGTLTLEQALALTNDQRENLESAAIRELLTAGTLTLEQVLALTWDQRNNLESTFIQELRATGTLTLEQVLALTWDQSRNLDYTAVQELLTTGTLTLEQVLALTWDQRNNLESTFIQELRATGTLTLEQVLALTWDQSRNLDYTAVQELLTTGTLTLEQALALTREQREILASPAVQELRAAGTLTLEQVLALSYNARIALRDPETRRRLRAGELTLEAIQDGLPAVANNLNDGQSTHTASVHKSVLESAQRLEKRYGSQVDKAGLESTVKDICNFIDKLSNNSFEQAAAADPGSHLEPTIEQVAAKRAISRITDPTYTFTDSGSQVTTRRLLALVWFAIQDDSQRAGTFEDAKSQFIEGLYEIQRGYNLSAQGLDDGEPDRFICSAGTFNKLIEKLAGIHPDCQILFITRETASLKLPTVVQEEVRSYLLSLSSQLETPKKREDFGLLIEQLEMQGVEVLWPHIKDAVKKRMGEEFATLYPRGEEDRDFLELIKTAVYVEVPDMTPFKASGQIQESDTSVSVDEEVSPETEKKEVIFSLSDRIAGGFFGSVALAGAIAASSLTQKSDAEGKKVIFSPIR